ncbi:aminotransferase class I/II-fold pyridoxal phosphate-dependent enzyme, partial [Streptomyces anulatus]|uniref:aminotransferase class I/II-fold pyridoxal phosphate-dependent enzyme n=1 Tax=Streptomyces anulatus TaxID=1892 RepID=UPI00344134B7
MTFSALNPDELTAQRDRALRDYDALVQRGLSLDLTRGKPSARQLDLASAMLTLPGGHTAADGTDCRNYGGGQGLPELRAIFSGLLQVPVPQLVAANNSSLSLMHDSIVHALLSGLPGTGRRWADEPRIAFLCPVPGYDRHFALSERFGIELIPVPMTDEGPDMDVVEGLVREDSQVKGIWCVPKYSNPSGVSYSDETVRRLAAMSTAAPDFRIFWDNAYAVHHLTETPVEIADLLALCAENGNPDRAFVFGSTSKITFAGGGVAFFGSSPANVAWLLGYTGKRTIGPDKINHLRHVEFLRDENGVLEHMRRHRELIRPKFEAVDLILTKELGGTGLASWSSPLGGYFVSLDVLEGCARQVVSRAAEAGIALTPAGATHPYGDDPADSTIRIAPSYPELDEVELA